jgi:hypothetical protein
MDGIALALSEFSNFPAHTKGLQKALELDPLTSILFGASAFQQLNAACELGLFDLLERSPNLSKIAIQEALDLQPRAADILLLGTTALQLTSKERGCYANAPVISEVFRRGDWQIFKDVVAFEQYIVYEGQVDYCESLKSNTNVGLRRIPGRGRDLYHRLAENPRLQEVFYRYMNSWSQLATERLLRSFPFDGVRHLLDMGGGDAVNAINLALARPNLKVTVFEIPDTAPIARGKIAEKGLSERIRVHAGDMFADEYPSGHDCIAFIHQLVIWTPEENTRLLKRAYDALPPGGRVIIFSSISDDEGDGPLMAALDSVYFAALPAEGGMIYSWEQYESWLRSAGFKTMERVPCRDWTPHGLIVATK